MLPAGFEELALLAVYSLINTSRLTGLFTLSYSPNPGTKLIFASPMSRELCAAIKEKDIDTGSVMTVL
jgi:hypothetical protein